MTNTQPEQELEVKFFDVRLDIIRECLQQIGARCKTPSRLMRRVVFGGEANPTMRCTYGRIRDEGHAITMSAKYSAVNDDIASQKEAMVSIDNFEQGIAVLGSFGLTRTNYQENLRETWQMPDGTLVELEEWPDLPAYIEIEGQTIENLQKTVVALGLKWDDHTTASTDVLYQKHYGWSDQEMSEKTAELRFDP